jgi:hypothetical protein
LPEIELVNQNINQNQDDLDIYIDNNDDENIDEFNLYFEERRSGRQVSIKKLNSHKYTNINNRLIL